MNIHPLFVHFPIALFSVYVLIELFRIEAVQRASWILPIKTILLVAGSIGAELSLITGESAEHVVGKENPALRSLIELHATTAGIATALFAVVGLAYCIAWFQTTAWAQRSFGTYGEKIRSIAYWYSAHILTPWIVLVLACVGMIAITIAGGLGGAIVYGPSVDPIVAFIYKLFSPLL